MATYNVTAGNTAYSNTLVANTADTINFADRFGYVAVTNVGTSGTIWATANGVAALDGDNGVTSSVPVPPGQTVLISNGLASWGQSSNVIPVGTVGVPQGGGAAYATTGTNPGRPGHVHPYGSSLAGGVANDGTSVSIIATTANGYTVTAAG